MKSITLQIDGMSCASCVGRVERIIMGIAGATVNLANEITRLSFNSPVSILIVAEVVVRGAKAKGLEPPMTKDFSSVTGFGVLYLVSGLMLSPVLVAAAMALSSIFVLSNASRLRRIKPAFLEENLPKQQMDNALCMTPAQ